MAIAWNETPQLPKADGRIEAIDLARGIAIGLMIVSHSVSGLVGIRNVPDWGMVPVHLLTKFSSSLFIVVFGIALAVAFLSHTQSDDWPKRRLKLWLRAVEVWFWYKALLIIEMLPFNTPSEIVDALLYGRFGIWVEILGFYAIALLWVPLMLPLWARAPLWSRLATIGVLIALTVWLQNLTFGGNDILKALLVDHEDHYTWGQISRAPLILVGLLIGEALLRCYFEPIARRRLVLTLLGLGALMVGGFYAIALASGDVHAAMLAVANNVGKHPPGLQFMLFSLGGALVLLALALAGGAKAAKALLPLTIVGSDALKAFIFHIVVIFLMLRFLWKGQGAYSYPQALGVGGLLILGAAAWIWLTRWMAKHH
ncbi:heparan-alpha-glucosaminide N-acetyltransferase domain-containing protein [Halovibrio sp. HP20-50]|uniref:heparan-alpha-glucosaminide N-acetyltransferase domain-containing protein n=1 Tax=Halovibrio sp. HP20-59 TaxID=3080275 RepID=UPI00294B42B9|nr:heparan-alpha-glucosaminide N-acetyltransferase domain-containing protein [Halovibrio sp. HP20-59]MEA2119668.1 heparan-alpha-glucosaminide N-acetyltransferase domain-containing protein [Halovibrio sp. HP20-59]